jgi:hypothetical protein
MERELQSWSCVWFFAPPAVMLAAGDLLKLHSSSAAGQCSKAGSRQGSRDSSSKQHPALRAHVPQGSTSSLAGGRVEALSCVAVAALWGHEFVGTWLPPPRWCGDSGCCFVALHWLELALHKHFARLTIQHTSSLGKAEPPVPLCSQGILRVCRSFGAGAACCCCALAAGDSLGANQHGSCGPVEQQANGGRVRAVDSSG